MIKFLAGPRPRSTAQLIPKPWLGEQAMGCVSQRDRVIDRNRQTRLLMEADKGNAAGRNSRIDDWTPAGHGLDLHEPKPLAARVGREPESSRGVVGSHELFWADVSFPDDAVRDSQLVCPTPELRLERARANYQKCSRHTCQSFQGHVQALVIDQTANRQPDRLTVARPQVACVRQGPSAGPKVGREVHTQRQSFDSALEALQERRTGRISRAGGEDLARFSINRPLEGLERPPEKLLFDNALWCVMTKRGTR